MLFKAPSTNEIAAMQPNTSFISLKKKLQNQKKI